MEKLTIEHLAPYLPYKLKCILTTHHQDFEDCDFYEESKFSKGAIWVLSGYADSELSIPMGEGEINDFVFSYGSTYANFTSGIKPLLRPLSDLTKEIDHKGVKFIPIDYNAFKHSKDDIIEYQNGFIHYKAVKFGIIQRLFEWHFDVFSLLDKGLAIDINLTK